MSNHPGVDQGSGYVLAYPVYLDENMMTSFLAHLEGGVAKGNSVTSSAQGAIERSRKIGAALRASAWFIDAEATGDRAVSQSEADSTQITFEKNHTSASLFNILYEYLTEDGLVSIVSSAADLDNIQSGSIIELLGSFKGNSFEDAIDAAAALIPYIQELNGDEPKRAPEQPRRSRSSKPERRKLENKSTADDVAALEDETEVDNQAAGMRLAIRLVSDANTAPVRDLVVETAAGMPVVLTVLSEFYGPQVKELMRDGEFRVVGKVTRIFDANAEIRLSRRSVLGSFSSQIAQEVVGGVLAAGLQGSSGAERVVGPSLQVLPMAIFV